MSERIVFIFVDGVGLDAPTQNNPFRFADMPCIQERVGAPLLKGYDVERSDVLLKGIDACLDIEGIPQSATGQTALFTGINAAQLLGYHLPAFPNEMLKALIDKDNIFKRAVSAGKRTIFANSYTSGYFDLVAQGRRQHSVTTLCVLAAGLPFRNMKDLTAGKAVHWDITRVYLNEYQGERIPPVSPEEAGKHLALLSREFDLVGYECFLPDLIGHTKDIRQAVAFLEMFDRFLYGVVYHVEPEVSIIISSDHGNIEKIDTAQHTRNPVPLVVIGRAAEFFRDSKSITDLTQGVFRTILPSL